MPIVGVQTTAVESTLNANTYHFNHIAPMIFRVHFPKQDKKLISQILCFYKIFTWDEDSDMAKKALKMRHNSMDDAFTRLCRAAKRKQRHEMVVYDHDGLVTKLSIASVTLWSTIFIKTTKRSFRS